METEFDSTDDPRRIDRTSAAAIRADGAAAAFLAAAATFFLGSAVLTQSGQPGASTPAPWIASHGLWVAATAFVATGTVAASRRIPGLERSLAGPLARGAFGLGTLHALQWTTWVYVDVVAYQRGAHPQLLDPLLHPFGTGHMLMYGVIVGTGVAVLAWGCIRTERTPRAIDYAGVAVGTATVLAAVTSLVTFGDVKSATGLATILLLAVNYGWLTVFGIVLYRRGESI